MKKTSAKGRIAIPKPSLHLSPTVGILILSTLWAIAILRPELLPNLIQQDATLFPATARLFLPCALLFLAATAAALVRRDPWPDRRRQIWPPVLTGLGLFAVPPLLTSLPGLPAEASLDAYTRTTLFTLIPILSLILEPHIHPETAQPGRFALPASLAAVFGALCIFPIQFPGSLVTSIAFLATVLAAASIATASITVAANLAPNSRSRCATFAFAAMAAFNGAAAIAIVSLFQAQPLWTWRPSVSTLVWTSTIELPALLLLFLLLSRMPASRASTRYLFAPLIAILAGAVLLQQPLTGRTIAGLVLMATGAIYLLVAPAAIPESSTLSLRQ